MALKETTAINNSEARRAFEHEASLLGNLRHAALPKVMDYFCQDEADYLIMEYIKSAKPVHERGKTNFVVQESITEHENSKRTIYAIRRNYKQRIPRKGC